MRAPILITGVPRSGTSMTAGVINLCGAFGGITSGPNMYNRKGMFENGKVREKVIKTYLRSCGLDPLGQNPLPAIDDLKPYPNLREKLVAIIKGQGYEEGPWFYKGAKMTLLWPLFHEAFPGARWIIVRRRDEDIINSCFRCGFMKAYTTSEGWQGWIDHHKRQFETMLKHPDMDVLEFWPEELVRGSLFSIKHVIAELGLVWNQEAVLQFVEPKLWRSKDGC